MKLTDCVVDISRFSFPIGKKDIFHSEKPLVLEIGFGEGEFLINAALGDKNRNYVGFEVKGGKFLKAVRETEKLSLENLKFVHVEAEIALRQVFRERMFDLVLVNFPDPWPKKKHSKHRMFNREFIYCLAKALKKSGKIIIKTDQITYIEQIVCEFKRSRLFRLACPPPGFTEAQKEEIETKFEKHFREDSKKRFCAIFLNFASQTS